MNKLIIMLLVLLSNNAFSMLVALADAPFIVDYQGQLYDVVRKDLGHIDEVEDLPSKLIPQQDWHTIIAKGSRVKANRLLRKLVSYLPKDELWQYINTGLLRNDGFEHDRVADNAYELWSSFVSMNELTAIRINPQYHRNLSVLAHWKGLFSSYKNNIEFDKLDEVVNRLSKHSMNVEYSKRQLLRTLRIKIVLSTDKEKLIALMHHKNFNVALASWYALSKLAPKEVAYEIMTDAIIRTDSLGYSYVVGGDQIFSEELSAGHAAYDLFSDYLSKEQLVEIIARDLSLRKSFLGIEVRSRITVKALQVVAKTDPDTLKYVLQNWNLQQTMAKSSIRELKQLMLHERLINNELFSYKLYTAIKELSFDDSKMDSYDFEDWIFTAFRIHNDNAKKLMVFFISGQSSKINLSEIISALNSQIDWPRDWQDIRTEVKNKFIALDLEHQ